MQDITTVARAVRNGCIEAALQAYEEAGINGLCAEGRWELAIQAMRCLELDAVLSGITERNSPTE